MGKKENKVEHPVCKYAEEQGFEVRKVQFIGRQGAPDRLLMGRGEVFFIEFKSPDGDLEPWQGREIERIRDAGVKVYVVDDVHVGKFIIDGIKGGARIAGEMNANS